MMHAPPNASRLKEALAAELASAAQPQSVERRRELVALYRQAGIHQAADSELIRLFSQFPQDQGVLADMLDLMRSQRRMPSLIALIKKARALADRSEALRLSLAQALETMGELERAAEEYAALMQTPDGRTTAADAAATFLRSHPDLTPLRSALMTLWRVGPSRVLPPPLRYAVFRAAVETDKSLAREQLRTMFHPAIEGTELILDVAVQAFRLGRWDEAVRAARRAMAACANRGQNAVSRLLVSIHAFAGDDKRAARRFKDLGRSPGPIRLEAELLRVLMDLVVSEKNSAGAETRSAVLEPSAPGRWRIFAHAYDDWDAASARLESRPSTLSASVIRSDWRQTGPWEVLAEVDFLRPHLMVQLGGKRPFLHAFIAAEDGDVWPWQEVPAHVPHIAEADPHFRWLRAYGAAPAEKVDAPARALWRRVEAELRNVRMTEKGNQDG